VDRFLHSMMVDKRDLKILRNFAKSARSQKFGRGLFLFFFFFFFWIKKFDIICVMYNRRRLFDLHGCEGKEIVIAVTLAPTQPNCSQSSGINPGSTHGASETLIKSCLSHWPRDWWHLYSQWTVNWRRSTDPRAKHFVFKVRE